MSNELLHNSARVLEFDSLRELLRGYASSPLGQRKIAALARYASQQHRRYSDPDYIRNLARMHGINVNRDYAEVFQVYRVVA